MTDAMKHNFSNIIFSERINKCATPEEMRAELFRLRYHDPIVRSCWDAADYTGMSAEDKYTLMAYHLIDAYYRVGRIALDQTMLNPMPPLIFSEGNPLSK